MKINQHSLSHLNTYFTNSTWKFLYNLLSVFKKATLKSYPKKKLSSNIGEMQLSRSFDFEIKKKSKKSN